MSSPREPRQGNDVRGRSVLCIAAAFVAAVLLGGCATRPPYRIVAYAFERTDIPRIGAEKLTAINYAFAVVSPSGEVAFRTLDTPTHFEQLVALKRKNPALKVIVSIGGWGADNFSDAALTPESRDRFASSLTDLIRYYDLDGADLDWEYPGQPGPGIKFRTEDKQNFTLLLQAIRCHFEMLGAETHRRYVLTIASSAGHYFATTEMDRLHIYLDWINVMTYDFYTETSHTTGHHTALYSRAPAVPSTQSFIEQHLAAGIPPEKLVVGAAFYGRAWSGVTSADNGTHQPAEKYAGGNLGYARLSREYVNQQGFTRYWDRAAHAPYLWNPQSRTWITYDDPQSLAEKARYVRRHHLGGVMYWEHSHDPNEVLLNILFEKLQ